MAAQPQTTKNNNIYQELAKKWNSEKTDQS